MNEKLYKAHIILKRWDLFAVFLSCWHDSPQGKSNHVGMLVDVLIIPLSGSLICWLIEFFVFQWFAWVVDVHFFSVMYSTHLCKWVFLFFRPDRYNVAWFSACRHNSAARRSVSHSQAAASGPLPLQGCKLKGGNFLVESVRAAASWTTLSAPSQQQSLAPGTQAFDPGSGQKVGFDH